VRTGLRTEVDETAFYAAALSGSGGRAVVRDWIDTTVGDVKRNLGTWFSLQAIVDPYGEGPTPMGLTKLARGTVREVRDLPSTTTRALLRSALLGLPLPWGLVYQVVRRIRAEAASEKPGWAVTHPRASLIKLVLLSHDSGGKEDHMVRLDEDNLDPAYRCGRLLAVLEQVQRNALPGAKATIVDRFFGTASSAPASVFGRLLRGAQPHLAKLERDRRGTYVALQRRLEEVQSGLTEFPRTLSLQQQGLFALGYYHQRAFDREQARLAKERRRAGVPTDADELVLDEQTLEPDMNPVQPEE
jgi:CRISPR-associated protein Csd1